MNVQPRTRSTHPISKPTPITPHARARVDASWRQQSVQLRPRGHARGPPTGLPRTYTPRRNQPDRPPNKRHTQRHANQGARPRQRRPATGVGERSSLLRPRAKQPDAAAALKTNGAIVVHTRFTTSAPDSAWVAPRRAEATG
eukprot:scaffold21748_cov129-Isochrysis_galbana.AAC.5